MKRTLLLCMLVACEGDSINETAAATATTSAAVAPEVTASTSAVSSAALPEPQRKPPADLWGDKTEWEGTLDEQNAHMLDLMEFHLEISKEQRNTLAGLFEKSGHAGQGNPEAAKHAASPQACMSKLEQQSIDYRNADFEKICDGKYMAPLYDPDSEKPEDAKACIDMFEFPNIPCVYPVTWVRANESVQMCKAIGKRLCDAHEWEGACWGKLTPPDDNYNFGLAKRMKADDAVRAMRGQHNSKIHKERRWAYGEKSAHKGVCPTASRKSKDCGQGWRKCGTNTFPAGFYPGCVSRLGVYDQHGNAAEHMNLPLAPEQMSTAVEQEYGHTEMKGSWFVFDIIYAHKDHCRWRAPYWHGTTVMNENSHRNYHLGFRCCSSVEAR